MKKSRTGYLFLLPGLAGTAVFHLVPFLDVVRRSFTNVGDGSFAGLSNYRAVFANPAFRLAAKNTLRFFGVCVPLLVGLSLLIALLLVRQRRTGAFLKRVFLFPMAVPVASAVLLWRVLFHARGMFSGLAVYFGGQGEDWMNTGAAFWVLVGSYLWKNLGYDIVLWTAARAGIPENLYEAARADGAGDWQCFRKITVPCLLPALFTITVLSLLNAFKAFREAYLAAGDYPHESMYLLQHLFQNWYRELDMDKMAAAAVICVLVILLLVLCLQKAWDGQEEKGKCGDI